MSDTIIAILVASIPVVGALAGIALKYYLENKDLQKELTEIKQEIKTSVSLSLDDINKLDQIIKDLFKDTKVDRFVVFKGENGGLNPLTFTSAILERHKDNMYMMLSLGATDRYVKVRFDNTYLGMLDTVERTKEILHLDVKNMPQCDLKEFYEAEQVKHSAIGFQMRYPIHDDKHIIIYFSFATHTEFEYTEKEKTFIRLAADRIGSLNFEVVRID